MKSRISPKGIAGGVCESVSTLFMPYIDEQNNWPRYADQRMTLAFRHLDVLLTIVASKGSDARTSRVGSTTFEIALVDDRCDPVIARLSHALSMTEAMGGADAGIYADALRLAIAVRTVGLHGKTECHANHAGLLAPSKRRSRPLREWRLRRVTKYIDGHLTDKLTLPDLAAAAGLSRMHFASQFRAATGMRPHDYFLRRRIQRAQDLLRQTSMTLAEISAIVGFQNQSHFTTVFKRFVGETPYQWRNMKIMEHKSLL